MDDSRFRLHLVAMEAFATTWQLRTYIALSSVMTAVVVTFAVMLRPWDGLATDDGLFLSLLGAFAAIGWQGAYSTWLLRGARRLAFPR